MTLQYVKGDATSPIKINKNSKIIIPHVCNNLGSWGAGFVVALSKKWKEPESFYRNMDNYILGDMEIVECTDDIYVCNMIGQDGVISAFNKKPIRYDAVCKALVSLRDFIGNSNNYEIHAPKFGSGLAGGDWNIIETIICYVFEETDINIVIYEF